MLFIVSFDKYFLRCLRAWVILPAAVGLAGACLVRGEDYGDLMTMPLEAIPAADGVGRVVTWRAGGGYAKYRLMRFGGSLATRTIEFPEGAGAYTDVEATGVGPFEYRLQAFPKPGGVSAYGHVIVGSEVAWEEERGGILLVVTAAMAAEVGGPLERLTADLTGEGWRVNRIEISGAESPASVKAGIQAVWQDTAGTPATELRAVLLIGHVPVAYSGNICPDGHSDHRGAWPCDAYYGDMDITGWTDTSVSNTNAARTENRNVPGDGKFDQSYAPSAVELSVGRLDFSGLPAFAHLTEADLLRRYLERNHAWRIGALPAAERCVLDDNLAALPEGVGAAGRRAIMALAGVEGICLGDFLNASEASVFGLGTGYGGYSDITGVGSTGELAAGSVGSVFNMVFGSYCGDWDTPDNIVRAVIAAGGAGLASIWNGRPNCHLTGMAIGRTIGECVRTAMSPGSTTCLHSSYYPASVHQALHGDPTLRLRPIAPVTNLRAVHCGTRTLVAWDPSPAMGVAGYAVFRADSAQGPFTRITSSLVQQASWIDPGAPARVFYRVNALRLETTQAGTWWNGSTSLICAAGDPPRQGEIAAWQHVYFGTEAAPSTIADTADPDADGASNLLEFLCGTDPCCSLSAPEAPSLNGDVLTWRIATGVTEAIACAETSANLATWEPCPVTTLTPGYAGKQTIQACLPDDPQALRRFFRFTAARRQL